MRVARLLGLVLVAAVLAASSSAYAAPPRPPGVDALVSASAKGRLTSLVTPRVRTWNPHSLLLAFVVAGGAKSGERVRRISARGLRWVRVVRSAGAAGAVEIWQARARNWWSGRVAVTLASAAYPASVTIVAYGGSSPYLSARRATKGHSSLPRIKLKPVAGSLIWTVGLSQGQRTAAPVWSASPSRRVVFWKLEPRRRIGTWVELALARTSHVASSAGSIWARDWQLASVNVVVPNLKALIEAGELTAYGSRRHIDPPRGLPLPRYCPPNPAFEVGVQDDPVFLGLQPAMSPERGFQLASEVFHAHLLRLNMMWGEFKRYGWAPYDRAVQMARERCWAIHITIMPTPLYAESYLPHELSGRHLDLGLLASFSREIATRYAGEVGRFAIGNEPDEGRNLVLTGHLATDLAMYDRMYMAGYTAVKAADPSAQVIAGELAGRAISEWLDNVAALPNDGVGVHPYGLSRAVGEYVRFIAPVPLLITEDGVPAYYPNQLAMDLEREENARAAGARSIIFYQLSRADTNERFKWDTGLE